FSTMPSENWKNGVGSALTAYAAGTGDWNAVVTAFVDGWKTEAALNAG
ncbi:MAG TPA: ABC transporter substrate-binding protein, partial [Ruminococcaceae bacterium]|nr:ABC transporter substrate-binding protein [Oscillospiraceae bacterium]